MDISRIQREVAEAQRTFSTVQLYPTTDGKVYVKTALQTTQRTYIVSVKFPDTYPNELPRVYVDAPPLSPSPHKFDAGNICYLYPPVWNPGFHTLSFVIGRAAKWLGKYEIYKAKGYWPGVSVKH